jgi:nucleotide-binding universal stress UspA family protein
MTYRRIVIGVDFSTASLNAVRWVAAAFAPRATLYLTHVVARPRVPSFLRAVVPDVRDREADEPTLYPGLSGFAGFAGVRRAEVSVRSGEPAEQLAALADEVDAELICVGRSRRRRGTGRFGATTPQRLLARTRRSLLLVPSVPPAHRGKILAAVSDGVEGEDVLRAVEPLAAEWRDARVDVLHALHPSAAADASHATDLHRLTEAWLEHRTADLPALRSGMTAIACTGDAPEAILTHAVRAHSDLIVMGRRAVIEPSTGLECCVGSTTRLITWTTPCPVLVVGAGSAARSRHEWGAPRRSTMSLRTHAANEQGFRRRRSDQTDPLDGGDAA